MYVLYYNISHCLIHLKFAFSQCDIVLLPTVGPATAQNGMCDLERSCCAHSAELIFKNATTQSYQQQVQNMLAEILMPCHNHNFSGKC